MDENPEVLYCPDCWAIIPYVGCAHDCPGDWLGNIDEEEGFCKEEGFLERFYEELRWRREVLEMIQNQPGQEYDQTLHRDGEEQSYHIRQEGEVVLEGVEIIQVRQIGPQEFIRLEQ